MRARGTRAARWRRAATGALVAATAVACAVPVTGRAAAPDPALLPSVPGQLAPGIVAPPTGGGVVLESIRIASVTPIVLEHFPDRAESCPTAGDLTSPEYVEQPIFPVGTVAPILQEYGFVAGWRACGGNAEQRTLVQTLELADPAAARGAATELAAASLRSGERQLSVLGGATAQQVVEDATEYVQIWVPVGRTLGYLAHGGAPGAALTDATRLAETHARLLETFTPTPQADVPALPRDPYGLIDRVVQLPGQIQPGGGPYDLAATLHRSTDPVADRALLTANGFIGSWRRPTYDGLLSYTVLLQAFPGPVQAGAVQAAFLAEADAAGRPRFAVPTVPDAACTANDYGTPGAPFLAQRCYVVRGGYLATLDVGGSDSIDNTSAMASLLPAQVDLLDG
jgi:hypothetical protein